MPKENQKRGRRMKRKHDEDGDPEAQSQQHDAKRRKSIDVQEQQDFMPLDAGYDDTDGFQTGERAFFGMLDEKEQEYFKQADDLFELNSFESSEERLKLVEEVYREADGKELKIAQSQSCSRLLERLIQMSSAAQLKNLFQKFSGNFLNLMSHRFASHCCESLFTYAAPFVSAEMASSNEKEQEQSNPDEIYVSMENLFLHTLAELDGNLPYMLTERYASHTLRALLLVLSGEPIKKEIDKQASRNRGRETVVADDGNEKSKASRPVPESFSVALEKVISGSIAGFDTPKLRALATHPIASPTLQQLLRIEMLHYGKQRAKDDHSIIHTLLPDDPFTLECESAAFLSGLAYDAVGAHLVEAIIRWAPAKLFKKLYATLFKERLASYARNEIATYIDCRIIERLGYDDLMDAHEIIAPLISSLCERKWTALTKTLIERCTARKIDTQAIAVQLDEAFSGPDGFDIQKMLFVTDATDDTSVSDPAAAAFSQPIKSSKLHFNILAQTMLIVPGSLSSLVLDALIGCDAAVLLKMAHDSMVTRTLQQALTTPNASIIQRRKLIQHFYGQIGAMALDRSASHVVDCIWEGTHGLAFIRERIAEELAENEPALRESPCGRMVWKNWKMDIYKRRRGEWIRYSKIKASNDGFQSFEELNEATAHPSAPPKTPLQLARERHVRQKAERAAAAAGGVKEKSSSTASASSAGLAVSMTSVSSSKPSSNDQEEKVERKKEKKKKPKNEKREKKHRPKSSNSASSTNGTAEPAAVAAN